MAFVYCLLLASSVLHAQALEKTIRSTSSARAHLSSHATVEEQKIDSEPQVVSVPSDFKVHRKHGGQIAPTGDDSVKVTAHVDAGLSKHVPVNEDGGLSKNEPGILENAVPDLVEEMEADPHEMESKHGGLEEHGLAMYVVLPVALAMLLAMLAAGLTEWYEISWLPESVVTLFVGALLGVYMQAKLKSHGVFVSDEGFNSTCATLITLFLLPMLIFQSGWAIRISDFASQFEHILVFAIFGSLISFVVVGLLIYWTGDLHLGWHSVSYPRTAFAYASLIAATDPVATLNTYSKLKVDPLLNIMVFGDSTFNDAVAIVLFKVLNNNDFMGKVDSRPGLGEIVLNVSKGILQIFFGSLMIGLISGMAFLLVLRVFHMRHLPRLEILCLIAHGYVTFALAETCHLSGIVATIFCSMLLGIYVRPHLSPGGSIMSDFFLKQIASMMDTAIFLLTGFCVVKVTYQGAWFSMFAMLFCLLGRACAVFPMGLISNYIKKFHDKTTGSESPTLSLTGLFMMWHAGLRGGIALALCMQLGSWVDALDGAGTSNILHTATFLLIVVFLLVFGGSTETLLVKLGVPHGEDVDIYMLENADSYQDGSRLRLMQWIDQNIMVPIFVGDDRLAASVTDRVKEMEIEDVLEKNILLRTATRRHLRPSQATLHPSHGDPLPEEK